MQVFPITNHADQQFGTIINNRRVTVRLRYNVTTDRWSFDLSLDDMPVLYGRRIVTGIDLLAPYRLGIGMFFAGGNNDRAVPGRNALPSGEVIFFQVTEAEFEASDAAISA